VRWPVAIARKFGRVIPEAVERFFADQFPLTERTTRTV
jgi:hypothetical protein